MGEVGTRRVFLPTSCDPSSICMTRTALPLTAGKIYIPRVSEPVFRGLKRQWTRKVHLLDAILT